MRINLFILAVLSLSLLNFVPEAAAEREHADLKKLKHLIASAREARQKNEFESALSLYQEAVEEADKFPSPGLKSWEAWYEAGQFFLAMRQYNDAAAQFKKGAESVRGMRKEDRFLKAQFLAALGRSFRFADYNQQAEKALSEARDLIMGAYGPNDTFLAPVLCSLGTVYLQQKRYSEAEETLKRGLKLAETERAEPFVNEHSFGFNRYKPDPRDVSLAQSSLGFLYKERKDYAEAEDYFRKSLHTIETAFGKDSPNLAAPLRNLALTYLLEENLKDSEGALLRELLLERDMKGGMLAYGETMVFLARIYWRQNRQADVQRVFEKLIEHNQTAAPSEDYLSQMIPAISKAAKDWKDISRIFDLALAAGEKTYRPPRKIAGPLASMMQCAVVMEENDAAERYGKDRIRVLRSASPLPVFELSAALGALADFYLKTNRTEEASSLAKEQAELLERHFKDSDSRVARAWDDYADLLLRLGRKEEADRAKTHAGEILVKALLPK